MRARFASIARAALCTLLIVAANLAVAAVKDCTATPCTFVTDPWAATDAQPSKCRLYDNFSTLLAEAPVVGAPGAVYCSIARTFAEGSYSLTMTGVDDSGNESGQSNILALTTPGAIATLPPTPPRAGAGRLENDNAPPTGPPVTASVVTEKQFSRNNTAATSVQVPASWTPGANNALLLVVWVFDSGVPVSVSSIGNAAGAGNTTWTELTDVRLTNSGAGAWKVYLLPQASAVATQPVVNFTATMQYPAIYVAEISGLTASPYLTGAAQFQSVLASGTDNISSGNTPTLSTQPAFVFGFAYQTYGLDTPSAGTGYTALSGVWDFEALQAISARPMWKRVTSTAAVSATASAANTSDYQTFVIALQEAAGGVTATSSITESTDTASAAAGVSVAGAASITEAANTSTAAAGVAVGASASVTEAADTSSSGAGVLVNPGASVTEAADTVSSSAAVTSGASANASITEVADTVAASGGVPVNVTSASSEAADSVSGAGQTSVSVSVSASEGADTASASTAVASTATASATEAANTSNATAIVAIAVAASATEGADTDVSAAAIAVVVAGNVTEGADATSSSSAIAVGGLSSVTEQADTVAATASTGNSVQATAGIIEAADTAASAAMAPVGASSSMTEGADTLVVAGVVLVLNIAVINDAADFLAATASGGGGVVTVDGPRGSMPELVREHAPVSRAPSPAVSRGGQDFSRPRVDVGFRRR